MVYVPPAMMIRTDLLFPLQRSPLGGIRGHGRQFNATRHGKGGVLRRHAAVDLLAPIGTPVYAMADGITGEYAPHFYTPKDQAIAIVHDTMTVRYCEIQVLHKFRSKGVAVKAGEQIGAISVLAESHSSMLHLEMYNTTHPFGLTVRVSTPNSFQRAATLVNPTLMVEIAAQNSGITIPKG